MSDLFMDRKGVYAEPRSLGKGYVGWMVHFPTLAKRNPNIQREYRDFESLCRDLKKFLRRSEVDPETAALVDRHLSAVEWANERG